ncbi:MAG: transposase [Candidatus Cloacimonetes bacterium]|nr:transposase [Candidatus Cloacimonadota bacterium]MCF7814671.1 transposase [Candidatus Cloacimonadota bacterium]MCF7868233.1 transposase [Candidatus Cloacimonadota bacterium]MCF7883666.1 transposase [Candidatus Cloacimonadota bacterium]
MPSSRISKEYINNLYFVTCTIKNWYYIFDRYNRWEILLEALRFYQKNHNLKIYSWVFMLNHIHLILHNPENYNFLQSFKSYTAHELIKNLRETEPNILRIFKVKDGYNIWRDKNYPEMIESERFFIQKAKYIENNPVKKGYVYNPQEWKYSSANEIQLLNITRFGI